MCYQGRRHCAEQVKNLPAGFFVTNLQHFYSLLQAELVANIHFTFISALVSCPSALSSAFRQILLDLYFQRALSNMQLTTDFVL